MKLKVNTKKKSTEKVTKKQAELQANDAALKAKLKEQRAKKKKASAKRVKSSAEEVLATKPKRAVKKKPTAAVPDPSFDAKEFYEPVTPAVPERFVAKFERRPLLMAKVTVPDLIEVSGYYAQILVPVEGGKKLSPIWCEVIRGDANNGVALLKFSTPVLKEGDLIRFAGGNERLGHPAKMVELINDQPAADKWLR